ncbi:MAG: T9SS type A sorting domain-containing protein [Bacteroidia bacterium]|nr:T9SS type A sorting domain-containing protein [Bacteroidia bacterium]
MKSKILLLQLFVFVSSVAQINVTNLGMSGNMFTSAFGTKTYLWADPNLNTIVYIHRGGTPTGDPNTGYLRYDISKDGGASWTSNVGPVFTTPLNNHAARYPQCVIYNPPSNTVPDSAFLAYYAPCANPSYWNSQVYGRSQIGGNMLSTQRADTFNAGFTGFVPEEFFVTQQGIAWLSDLSCDSNSGDYRDSILLYKGVWNTSTNDFDYTRSRLYMPLNQQPTNLINSVAYGDHRLSYAPNGNTGYLVVLGHNASFSSIDSSYYPIICKTTNGGQNWTSPVNVSLSGVGALLGVSAPTYTTGTELDMVVDMNGNPHIIFAAGISNGSWGMDTTYGNWGMFELWSPNGGSTWNMTLLHKPHRQYYFFDASSTIEEYTRPQASMNWAGNKVFFTWYVTDTTLNNVGGNSKPDAFVKAVDVVSGLWTDSVNVSAGVTNASGEMTFGVTSYYVLTPTSTDYEVPIAFNRATVPTDLFQPGQHKYLGNFRFNNADFNKLGNTVTTGIFSYGNNFQGTILAYPNPFTNRIVLIGLESLLQGQEKAQVTILNTLGENMAAFEVTNQNPQFEVQDLPNGVYFVQVQSTVGKVTVKVVKR